MGRCVVGTPENSAAIRGLGWQADLAQGRARGLHHPLGAVANHPVIAIASDGEIGALYGAFHFLRLMQTGQPIDRLNVTERPKVQLRLLNHWDNLDGTIERGYAGRSLWQWNELPGTISPRYADYARANASIGINGAVINNVNADVRILSPEYLAKVAALADVVAPVRRAHVSLGELRGADAAGRSDDRRSARPGRRRVVEGEGRRDLHADSGLRRLPRQGELRRAARPEGLRPHARRRRQRAGRRARAARRHT